MLTLQGRSRVVSFCTTELVALVVVIVVTHRLLEALGVIPL